MSMAMASSSSSFTAKWTYDVFLSFRGEDTRTNFVDHLYNALNDRAIYTFKDDHNLKRGASISPELIKAIEQSRFAVVVFSRNYADSSWCLDELVKIVDCKNSIGQKVLPVFYNVDPSEVRKQTGCFGEAFAKHEINGGKDEDRIRRWRNALAQAASIAGWALPNAAIGYESKCIKEIVRNISTNLGYNISSTLANNLIGMESRVQKVKSLLLTVSNEVHIVGIWGMGGIGKTTLARAVFNDISNQFEGKSFVANVREVSKSSNGLHSLQEKILSEILMERKLKVPSIEDGIIMMSRLCHKKVLLVLDDVDHVDQLEALVGTRDWFGKGSRIIITTRNEHLLVVHGVSEIHRAVLLNDDEAHLLFNRHAFKSNSPSEEYADLANLVVRTVGGLPLALNVLGSFLYGRATAEWKGAVDRLVKHSVNEEILSVLKISFDGLERNEREIFLDIACFFVGMKKDEVSKILDSFDFYPDIGLSVLIEKSLVNVSNGILQMHDMIKELAWDIIYQMDPKEPGRRSRLWLLEDVHAVLKNDTGTNAIEGIKLRTTNGVKLHKTEISHNFHAFRNMKKLRLLDVSYNDRYGKFAGPGPEYLSNELRWIHWHGYPSKYLPPSFQAEKLVSLHMHCSNIVQLWKGRKILDKLKLVDLSYAWDLTKTGDFSGAPNLERLILRNCYNLIDVHPSLGDLRRLTFLDLSACTKLKHFQSGLNMTSLEILNLRGCLILKEFPQILGNMERLKKLNLGTTGIKELHPSIGKLTGLVILDLHDCYNLTCLPSTIGHLKSAENLDLSGCTRLEELPETVGQMERLEEIHLHGTAITVRQQQSSDVLQKNLKILSFAGCKIPTSFFSSFFSTLEKSPDYPMDSFLWQNLSGILSLKKLEIVSFNLSEIPGNISQLYALEELRLIGGDFISLPDSLCHLSRLKILELRACRKLKALTTLPQSIAMLVTDDCVSLETLGDLLTTKHEWLHAVSLKNCFKLIENEQRSGDSSLSIADILSLTMLQWRSVIKHHQFSILVPGGEIPHWISHRMENVLKTCSLQLKLFPGWDRKIAGFAMCWVLRTGIVGALNYTIFPNKIRISLGDKYEKMLDHSGNWWKRFKSDHVWVGYISLDFFGQLVFGEKYKKGDDWVGGNETSFLRIDCWNSRGWPAKSFGNFGIHVVYKEDAKHIIIEEEDHQRSSANYANFGFFADEEENDN